MILAISPMQRPYRLGEPIENKEAVLTAMRSFAPTAYSEGPDLDYVTGQVVKDGDCAGYRYGQIIWTDEQIYNFDKYDLVLNPEFCEAIVALAESKHV